MAVGTKISELTELSTEFTGNTPFVPIEYSGSNYKYDLRNLDFNTFTGNGSITNFVTKFHIESEYSLIVKVDDVKQKPITDYTVVAGSNLVIFNTAPAADAEIVIRNIAQSSDGFLTDYNIHINEITERNIANKLNEAKSIFDFGAVGDGATDDSEAFQAACLSGEYVIVPGKIGEQEYEYDINGSFPIASNTVLDFTNNPTITLVMNAGTNGDRGFWFQPSTTNSHIKGNATFYARNLVSSGDGSMGNVFTFGKYVYGDNVDAEKVDNCSVVGDFIVHGRQKNEANVTIGNLKTVGIYGWSENIHIKGIKQFGDNNFCFVCHWGQNITIEQRQTTPISTLPTKTWHPDNIIFEDCEAWSTWANCNGFTTSAIGRITFLRCYDKGTPEGWNLFCGDLGYVYQQNLDKYPYPRIYIHQCEVNNPVNYGMSIDQQTNPVGIFEGATLWTSADIDKGGYIYIDGFDVYLADADPKIAGIAVTGISEFYGKNINIIETDNTNTTRAMQFYGCNKVVIQESTTVTMQGCLVRNCGQFIFKDNIVRRFERDPNGSVNNNYGLTLGAKLTGDPETPESASGNSTVDGAVSLGDTSITLDNATIVAGAGGYIAYGSNRIKMLSSSFAGIGTQTIQTEPFHFTIADGETVSLLYTVQDCVIESNQFTGWQKSIRCTGATGAELGKLNISSNQIRYNGRYDIEVDNVKNLLIHNNIIDFNGQSTDTDRRSIVLGANVRGFNVSSNIFTDTLGKIRYHVYLNNDALNGAISGNIFRNYNVSGSNPACIYRDTSDVIIGMDNYYATGLTKIYPTLQKSFTPVPYGSSTAGSPTGTFTGTYEKFGKIVFVSVRLQFTDLSTMAGNLMLSGLPNTVSNNVNRRGGIAHGVINGKTTAGDTFGGYFVGNTTTIQFTKLNANNTNWVIGDLTSTFQVQFSGWYFTDE